MAQMGTPALQVNMKAYLQLLCLTEYISKCGSRRDFRCLSVTIIFSTVGVNLTVKCTSVARNLIFDHFHFYIKAEATDENCILGIGHTSAIVPSEFIIHNIVHWQRPTNASLNKIRQYLLRLPS